MADYTPVTSNGTIPFSLTASAVVTGGQVLASSGNGTVAPAGAASTAVVGVAAHDAPNGGRVGIWPTTNVLHETVNANAGAATAGNAVLTAAAGATDVSATPGTPAAAGTLIGTVTTGAASGAKMRWLGRG